MNPYIIANGILIILDIVGSFIIYKVDEVFWIGVNNIFIMWYLAILVVVAVIVNIVIAITSFVP